LKKWQQWKNQHCRTSCHGGSAPRCGGDRRVCIQQRSNPRALRDWKYKRALRDQAIEELRAAVKEGLKIDPGANLNIETIISRAKTQRSAAAQY